MYAPVRLRGEILQMLAKSSALITGRVLGVARPMADFPVHPSDVERINDLSRPLVGPIDSLAVYRRIESKRSGVSLLLMRSGRAVGMLRWRPDLAAAAREIAALQVLAQRPPASFVVPGLIAHDLVDDAPWVMIEPLPCGHRRPVTKVPDQDAMQDLAQCLAEGIVAPRRESHWVASHGDFSPWNLRRRGTTTYLYDWEDATWAPPGADALFFRITLAIAQNRPPITVPADGREAWCHLKSHVTSRLAQDPSNRSLLRLNGRIPALVEL